MSPPEKRPRSSTSRPRTVRSGDRNRPSSGAAPREGTWRGSRNVSRRGERTELGGDQVEGVQAVRELLRAQRREVFDIVVDDDATHSGPLSGIARMASQSGIRVRSVGAQEIRRLAGSEVPQGVIAFTTPIEAVSLGGLVANDRTRPFLVVLDGITDPQNLGALLRTALSAGATGVVLPRHHAVRLTPSAVKAAAGAVEHLPIALVSGIPSALQTLHRDGVWSVGLDSTGSVDVDEVALFSEPVALVLGAEGSGLSALTRQRCDVIARIELMGPLESLNVSAAGAVACFAVARRRARSEDR